MRLDRFYVLSVPYVAGIACFGGPLVGGFRITGWIFAVMLAAAPLVYLLDRAPSRFPLWIWLPWISIVALSLMWVDTIELRDIQNVCQILTPFVIAPIASKALKSEADVRALFRAFTHCTWLLITGVVLRNWFGFAVLARPMAMTAAIAGCVFVARFREDRVRSMLGWSGCLFVATLTGSRMATMAILLEWLVVPHYRRQTLRFVASVMIAGLAVALFYTPIFQERFFLDKSGTLSDLSRGDFTGTGRFEAWTELWASVKERPLFGAGANSSSAMVNYVWEYSEQVHNDYLKILLEQGTIGLVFFVAGVMGQVLSLRQWGFSEIGARVVARSAGYVGMMVFLVMALTDNPIIYGVWFTHPLFVLIGTSYSSTPGGGSPHEYP